MMNFSIYQALSDTRIIVSSLCFLVGTCIGSMRNEIVILEKENERLRKELISLLDDEDFGQEVSSEDEDSPEGIDKAVQVSRRGVIEIEEEIGS